MSEDIIRIDGVEYELREGTHMGCFLEHLRPKRKQTGLICKECSTPCVIMGADQVDDKRCPAHFMKDKWKPFYGKVVE